MEVLISRLRNVRFVLGSAVAAAAILTLTAASIAGADGPATSTTPCEIFRNTDADVPTALMESSVINGAKAILKAQPSKSRGTRTWADLNDGAIVGLVQVDSGASSILGIPKDSKYCYRYTVSEHAGNVLNAYVQRIDLATNRYSAPLGMICDETLHEGPVLLADDVSCMAPKAKFATATVIVSVKGKPDTVSATVRASESDGKTSLALLAAEKLAAVLVSRRIEVPGKLGELSRVRAQKRNNPSMRTQASTSSAGGYAVWFPCVISGCCRAF